MISNDIHFCEPWHRYFGKKINEFDIHTLVDSNTTVCTSSLFVSEFNQKVSDGFNKAQILISCIHEALKKIFNLHKFNHKKILLKIDRLGGRKNYKEILISWGANIINFSETNAISTYQCEIFNKSVLISFEVKGDTKHHVIAAASCFAKLQRELSMKNFNHWWKQKIPTIKETAGYYTDGKRFIEDIELYCQEHNIQLNSLERKL
jgi:ribonuclease HII